MPYLDCFSVNSSQSQVWCWSQRGRFDQMNQIKIIADKLSYNARNSDCNALGGNLKSMTLLMYLFLRNKTHCSFGDVKDISKLEKLRTIDTNAIESNCAYSNKNKWSSQTFYWFLSRELLECHKSRLIWSYMLRASTVPYPCIIKHACGKILTSHEYDQFLFAGKKKESIGVLKRGCILINRIFSSTVLLSGLVVVGFWSRC